MAKATTIIELSKAYARQRHALTERSRPMYKDKRRWREVVNANRRRWERQRRRSVGKSNRLGFRFTAPFRVGVMCENDMWAEIIRNNNRQHSMGG